MTTQTLTQTQVDLDGGKIKLYTDDAGVWLHENGDSFNAWKGENHLDYVDKDEPVFSFTIERSLVIERLHYKWSHHIPTGVQIEFTKVEVR